MVQKLTLIEQLKFLYRLISLGLYACRDGLTQLQLYDYADEFSLGGETYQIQMSITNDPEQFLDE